ncbi:MAG: radical SAM protein [Thermoanaerobaculia bacterium]|jgi:MoaA/NifB/PqqE/SkfB family radical SAM enzyme
MQMTPRTEEPPSSRRIVRRGAGLEVSYFEPIVPGGVVTIRVASPDSKGSAVRVDIYPATAPVPGRRHFGYWDVRAAGSGAAAGRLDITWDGATFAAHDGGTLVDARASGFRETGAVAMHVTILGAATPSGTLIVETYLLGWERTPPLRRIFASVTDRCNLDCIMCARSTMPYEAADIPQPILDRVMEAAPGVPFIALQGLGEPLLHRGLFEIVRELRRRMPADGIVGFASNATLLGGKNDDELLRGEVGLIAFSVDGATRETYERIRIGGHFDRLVEKISRFMERHAEAAGAKPIVLLNMVVFPDSFGEVPEYVRLAARCGIATVHVNYEVDSLPSFDFSEVRRVWDEARAVARDSGVTLLLPRTEPLPPEDERCEFMQTAVVVNTGEVAACCRYASAGSPPVRESLNVFGNLNESSLAEIWESEPYANFRRAVIERRWPESCEGCGYRSGMLL